MRKRARWFMPVVILFLGYGSAQAQSDAWIEYTVTGDFSAEGRDDEVVLCSLGGDGEFLVAARGVWTMDFELAGSAPGEHSGSFQVTLPADLEGAPSDVFARRMKGDGTATLSEAGTGAMGLPLVEVEFSAPELVNDGGQTIGVSGTFRCAVM